MLLNLRQTDKIIIVQQIQEVVRFEFVDSIEDSLELDPVPFALIDGGFATSIFSECTTLQNSEKLSLSLCIRYILIHNFF